MKTSTRFLKEQETLEDLTKKLIAAEEALGQLNIPSIDEHRLLLRDGANALERALEGLNGFICRGPSVFYTLEVAHGQIQPVFVSDNISDLTGFASADALKPAWWNEHVLPYASQESQQDGGAALANGGISRLRCRDGSYRWVEDFRELIRGNAGTAVVVRGVWHDITARLEAEAARANSERKFTQLFRGCPIAMSCTTHSGQITDVNERWCQVLGFSKEECVGRTYSELGIWEGRPSDSVAPAGSLRDVEQRFRRKDGRWGIGLLSVEKLLLGDEVVILKMLIDVTEKRAMEEQAYRAQRMDSVGRLAGGIAHDLNNILAPILMAAPMLYDDMPAEAGKRMAATIETSARRGAQLVKQLLLFGRGIEGQRAKIRPHEAVIELENMIRETFSKTIVITTRISPGLYSIIADPTQLHQVLLNLCVNSRDAMPDGGQLLIGVENVVIDKSNLSIDPSARPGPYVRIMVSDTGSGIPPDHLAKIFDPFFSTKPPDKGTGLGLSTVIGIVKSHSGFITVHSEVGVGTVFDVYFPAIDEIAKPLSSQKQEGRASGKGQTILLVEDEESIREVARDILVRQGYEVFLARDGAEAAHIFNERRGTINLVLTDFDMPVMDGISLLKILRCGDPSIPVVVCSGVQSGLGSRASDLAGLGVKSVLSKPYTPDQMLEAIERYLCPRPNSSAANDASSRAHVTNTPYLH